MKLRVAARLPGGDTVTRDVRDGVWAEPEGAVDVHLDGLWGLPGLVDGHAHLARETLDFGPGDPAAARDRARAALEAGVIRLLDKGWRDLTVIDLISSMPAEERPDVEAAGVILAVTDGYWGGFAREVPPGEVRGWVEAAAREGAGWVKLVGDWPRKGIGPVPNFTEEELAAAVATAEGAGSRVAIHTMAREVPSMAVRAGVHSIEHGLFLDEEDLRLLGERRGAWVPTVLRVEAVIRQLGADSSGGRLLSEGLANIAANLRLAADAGVEVQAGTDLAVGSDQVAREAIRLWELGLPARDVVDAVSGLRPGTTGFDLGAPANAVLFDDDPLDDLRILAAPRHVIRMGRLVG